MPSLLSPLGGCRHPCPECDTRSIATPERKGAIHLDCPVCQKGLVFRDARGGYECSACDQRFLIHQDVPHGYGGPEHVGGPLRWWERPLPLWAGLGLLAGVVVLLWAVPWSWAPMLVASSFWNDWRKKH